MNIRASFSSGTVGLLLLIATIVTSPNFLSNARAAEPIRIWVDSTGRYSVEAMLVQRVGDSILLRRKDGGQSTMPVDGISVRDQAYLAEYDLRQLKADSLSPSKPKQPTQTQRLVTDRIDDEVVYESQSRLRLPRSGTIAAENSELEMGVVTETTAYFDKPKQQVADPNPDAIELPLQRMAFEKTNTYDRCSQLHSVGNPRDRAIGMSVTVGFSLPGSTMVNRVIKFDLEEGTSQVIHRSEEAVTLLDHHVHSKRSLVLVGHGASGKGGSLAIATGWRSNEFSINYRRALPMIDRVTSHSRSAETHLRWARWIDDEHVAAVIDRSLVGWNLVSGEMVFRIDGIEATSVPAISGGRRYLAVPVSGGALLVDSAEGKVLGRIAGEARVVPSVSFSQQSHAIAMSSQRRLVVWDMVSATESLQMDSKRSLGSLPPIWVNSDLVLASSGILISVGRQAPLWRYHLTDTKVLTSGGRLALLNKRPESFLSVVDFPHSGARDAIQWIDDNGGVAANNRWELPGRSVWTSGNWNDRDVRIGSSGVSLLKQPTLPR